MSDITPPEPPHTSGSMKGGAESFLGKKIGPLSVGMYLLFFIAFLGVWYFWRSRSTKTGTNVVPTTFTGDGSTSDTSASQAGGTAASGGGSYGGAVSGPTGGSAATTVGQWATNAANYLTGVGSDPTSVQSALSAYLAGQQLTTGQQNLVNQAIQAEGSPPNGVIAANTNSQSIAYTVSPGDSLTSIAQMFYGDPTRWRDVYAANQSAFPAGANLSTPLHGGMTLTLPGNGILPKPGARDTYSGIPTGHKYTLQFGDTLIQLAERFYGNGSEWTKIAAANPKIIPDANHPPVGVTITIPS